MAYKEGNYDIVDGMITTSADALRLGARSTAALAVPILRNLIDVLKYPAQQVFAEGLRKTEQIIFDSNLLKKR